MTQTSNRLFDELAKLMTDAANVAQGVGREAKTAFRSQADRWVAELDLVRREDFDVVKEMASKARAENERLAERVAALEAEIATLKPRAGGNAPPPAAISDAAKPPADSEEPPGD